MALSKQERIAAAKELCKRLRYEPDTGEFIWIKPKTYSVKSGDVAGSLRKSGYRLIATKYKGHTLTFREHQLAWLIMTGVWPDLSIDHINQIKHDNRFENLRLATLSQQNGNRKFRNKDSGFRGVTRDRRWWKAVIWLEGRNCYLGNFLKLEDAVRAYDDAAVRKYGEFYTRQI